MDDRFIIIFIMGLITTPFTLYLFEFSKRALNEKEEEGQLSPRILLGIVALVGVIYSTVEYNIDHESIDAIVISVVILTVTNTFILYNAIKKMTKALIAIDRRYSLNRISAMMNTAIITSTLWIILLVATYFLKTGF